jgi:RNA polymerase sigma-70 factor (ECF subfamily)
MIRDNIDDEALIMQAAQGDSASLETLYDRYAPGVMGLALRIVGDRAAAEEVVQEAFWRVWRKAESYEVGRGKAAGWLFGIARNAAIDLWRRRKNQPQPASTEEGEERLELMPDPDKNSDVPESVWIRERRQKIQAALQTLPPAQQKVIELAYFGGLTRQEIAETTGEPLGTIHTRVRLALQKLREALQAQGLDE